ncbi:MAG: DUF2085 domain-containing protein [Bacteroidota bacterium]
MAASHTLRPVRAARPQSLPAWLSDHWFGCFLVLYGLWVFIPFLAPVLMHLGWQRPAGAIYFIYSFFCHQLPERSIFLFGARGMYSLGEIQAAWQNTLNPMILRQFIGNEVMGWKIAWSDRMISFYTSVWLFAVAWWPLRRKLRPVSWVVFALLLLPMALDGGSHAWSDIAGLGQGFRDANQWLALATGNSLPAWFYAGDALGSFNSWARWVTGILAGLGLAWLVFPYIFPSQSMNAELDQYRYGAILEQINKQNPHSSG